jgi:hypothetical protein
MGTITSREGRSSHHRLIQIARWLWVLYAVALLLLYLFSLPGYFERVLAGRVPDIEFNLDWPAGNAYFAARAAAAGLSLRGWLLADTAASLLIVAIHYTVAALIIWRLPRSGFGLLSAFVILFTGTATMEDATQVVGLAERLGPGLLLVRNLGALVWPLFPVWLYLFPDGRAVPRWVRWPIGVLMSVFALFMLIPILDSAGLLPSAVWQGVMALNEQAGFIFFLVLPGVSLALAAQVYRYWRVSGPVARQQTKWFLFGLAIFVIMFPLAPRVPLLSRIEAVNASLTLAIIPLTVGIALLRYRLWDVDVVVRRTVSYAILTGLLALIYLGSIVVLQRLLSPLTGNSVPATVLSTLLIAALFFPLRRRVQDVIDRRFYRRKYDAAQVLEGFTATARDETDLDRLTAELARVIQETMQPESVSVWLMPSADRRRPTAADGGEWRVAGGEARSPHPQTRTE